ncbi:CYFA0S07e02850g1_1 [Cyberlindnera fabianii]|uniref:CYFA0S07e02850g1_1 n=1 Tax=Cyberlindnera fabianii TaxID=36022 RepID=A0A061AVC8_CYBFA|nr:CYFA0S07e02850g1_1 [Cyberlindnera fabianii]
MKLLFFHAFVTLCLSSLCCGLIIPGIRDLLLDNNWDKHLPINNIIPWFVTPELSTKSELNIFITGATGYIGGQFLHEILHDKKHNFKVRALVRTEEKAQKLFYKTNCEVYTVIGDLDSLDLLREEISKADIVINAATNNHLPSTQVMDEVISTKTSTTILFHIAGVSVLSTRNQSDKYVWSDIADNKRINELPDDRPHIGIDRLVMNMKNKNPAYARPIVISPALIYGTSHGYDNVHSVQVPLLVRKSIELGQVFTIDDGEYDWSNVHIHDLGAMFGLLLHKLIHNKNSVKTGTEGYYFAETDNHTWIDVSVRASELLYEMDAVNTTEIAHLTEEESDKLFGSPLSSLYNTNALTKADLARSYGWEPSHQGEFWKSIEVTIADELHPGDDY